MKQGVLFQTTGKDLPGALAIGQRRYLGNKQQLLSFIDSVISRECGAFNSFGDYFAGTGVVSSHFNRRETVVISNELLYSNFCAINAFLSAEELNLSEYLAIISDLARYGEDSKAGSLDNYCSESFGDTYFGNLDAIIIGAIRERISQMNLTGRMFFAVLATLLYSADRIAFTCGHYDAFRKGVSGDSIFRLYPLALNDGTVNRGNILLNGFARNAGAEHPADIVYLDPPYNSRQYCDSYHVLENIARWSKPCLKGVARKFDRAELKSDFNLKAASCAMRELVSSLKCRYIVLSYSNMEGKGDSRSSNRISAHELCDILSCRGTVSSFEIPFKPFSAGKSVVEQHMERLYLCKVR
jgi:adenine-specific DNA-methyltransferase